MYSPVESDDSVTVSSPHRPWVSADVSFEALTPTYAIVSKMIGSLFILNIASNFRSSLAHKFPPDS